MNKNKSKKAMKRSAKEIICAKNVRNYYIKALEEKMSVKEKLENTINKENEAINKQDTFLETIVKMRQDAEKRLNELAKDMADTSDEDINEKIIRSEERIKQADNNLAKIQKMKEETFKAMQECNNKLKKLLEQKSMVIDLIDKLSTSNGCDSHDKKTNLH